MMKVYLIAQRAGHSFSPQIHAELSNYSYKTMELEKRELENFFSTKAFDALNVTVPYKTEVMQYLDNLSPTAREIGAVNTVTNRGGVLTGYNTDCCGFLYMLKRSGIDTGGKNVVIIGGGGAAKAVRLACEKENARSVRFLTHRENVPGSIERFFDAEILVNATPVGMFPDNGKAPVRLSDFKNCVGVLDVIYNPHRTALLSEAARRGIKYENGLSMLVAQAKRASEIFTETQIPDSVVEKIIRNIETQTKNIILIGMPGCGKSAVGELLARNMKREFFDCDRYIEASGKSPSEVIKTEGEAAFRKIESAALSELCKKSRCVIATGGGAVTREENLDLMRQNGYIIFIDRPLELLETKGRPLSENGAVEALYKERMPLYRMFCDAEVMNTKSMEYAVKEAEEKFLNR